MDPKETKALLMEVVGTFFLVYTIGMGASALGVGAALGALVYSGARTSGAHFNPSVTLAMVLTGRQDAASGAKYVVAQMVGAFLAALVCYCLVPDNAAFYPTDITATLSEADALLLELTLSFHLVWVILNVTDENHEGKNDFFGFIIGSAVMVGASCGATMNTVVGMSLDLSHNYTDDLWILILGPLVGGGLASLMYTWGKISAVHELVGTGFLALAIGITGEPYVIGYTLACQIGASCVVSGAHINPAVTLAMFISKAVDAKTAGLYALAQLAGAFAGAAVAWELVGDKGTFHYPAVASDVTSLAAMIAEMLSTALLVTVVFHSTAPASVAGTWFPVAIGTVVMAQAMGVGQYSGGAFNPAIGLGLPALAGEMTDSYVYIVGPLLGGALGAVMLKVLPVGEAEAGEKDYATVA